MLQPAHLTKHISLLSLSFHASSFHIAQRDGGSLNGTAVWLSGQALAIVFPALLPARRHDHPRAIELGSGTGLTALALCSLGWHVVATDTCAVLSSVLQHNIDSNRHNLPEGSGTIQARELDWTVDPARWTWSHPTVIASDDYTDCDTPIDTLHPPFDLIFTADTLYNPQLVRPLFRVLHALTVTHSTPIYLALERRDPRLIDDALQQAQELWSFSVERVPHKKVSKALVMAGCHWNRVDWEGVEIWKLVLQAPSV